MSENPWHLGLQGRCLCLQVSEDAGIYIWCARAPDGGEHDWFALYLGKANNLKERFKAYINTDGTFGPKREKIKYQMLCDMHRRGFDMQIRSPPNFKMSPSVALA